MNKYHMRKKEREITDKNEIAALIKKGKYTTIGLCRNNEPYVVTLSYGYDEGKSALYFHSAVNGLKIEFIKENPKVCATIIDDRGYQLGQCEHHYAPIVLWGKMSIVEELEEKKYAMDILLNHLEENSQPIKERTLKNEQVYQNIGILKLEITELTGKEGK